MEKTILNFHFDYLNPSLISNLYIGRFYEGIIALIASHSLMYSIKVKKSFTFEPSIFYT